MEEILKLIETVDPNDREKLDEIDARVWCFLNKYRYDGPYDSNGFHYIKGTYRGKKAHNLITSYCESRDALKAIRPEGWRFVCWPTSCDALGATELLASNLPTEELAELHAIIQAIAHEREQ